MSTRMLASAVLTAAAVLTACGSDVRSEPEGTLAPSRDSAHQGLGGPFPTPPLDVRAVVAEPSYTPGEPVEISFTYTNTGEVPMRISAFPPSIDLIRFQGRLPIRSYSEGSTDRALAPGESFEHSLTWDQRDTYGRQVTPGVYDVQIGQMLIDQAALGPMYSGNTVGIDKVLIEYPQGALERTIEPGLTTFVNGVAITLQRVEFSSGATRVSASVVPPGYYDPDAIPDDPNRPVMPPMSVLPFNPSARYQVDSAPSREAGGGGFRPREKDILITWDLEPVPSDAGEFDFTITSLGRWAGPWEFRLQL